MKKDEETLVQTFKELRKDPYKYISNKSTEIDMKLVSVRICSNEQVLW